LYGVFLPGFVQVFLLQVCLCGLCGFFCLDLCGFFVQVSVGFFVQVCMCGFVWVARWLQIWAAICAGLCGFFCCGLFPWVFCLGFVACTAFLVQVFFSQVCAGSCGSAGCWCGFVCAGCAGFFAWICAGSFVVGFFCAGWCGFVCVGCAGSFAQSCAGFFFVRVCMSGRVAADLGGNLCGFVRVFCCRLFSLGFLPGFRGLHSFLGTGFLCGFFFIQVCAGSCGSAGCWCGFVCAGCAGFFAQICAGLFAVGSFVWFAAGFFWCCCGFVCVGCAGLLAAVFSCRLVQVWLCALGFFMLLHVAAGLVYLLRVFHAGWCGFVCAGCAGLFAAVFLCRLCGFFLLGFVQVYLLQALFVWGFLCGYSHCRFFRAMCGSADQVRGVRVCVDLCGFFLLQVFLLCRPAGLQIRCRVEGFCRFVQVLLFKFVWVVRVLLCGLGGFFFCAAFLQGFVRLAQLSWWGLLCRFFLVRFVWVHAGVWGLGFVQVCAGSFCAGCMEFCGLSCAHVRVHGLGADLGVVFIAQGCLYLCVGCASSTSPI